MLEKTYKINLNKMEFTKRLRGCFVGKRTEFNAPNIFKDIKIEAISGKIDSNTFEISDYEHYYNSSRLIGKIISENEDNIYITLKKGLSHYNYYFIILFIILSLLPIVGIIYSLFTNEIHKPIWYIIALVFTMLTISQIVLNNYYWNNSQKALIIYFEELFKNEIKNDSVKY